MKKPLNGIRVLDLTNVLAGPYCCHQLVHLGAEVIKVEAPKTGDLARQLGADRSLNRKLMGISFLAQNAGKKSITLNLKSPIGKKLFLQLTETADVLVENFRPGVMKRLKLDYDQIKKINIPNESINQRWKLITPSKKEITVVPNYQNEQIEIKNTSELGSYDLYFEDDYYTSFSTFLSKFESPQIRADLDELIDQFNDTMITILDGQITEKIKANRFGQSMWRLFLILAIIFYLIESVISRPAKKQANL